MFRATTLQPTTPVFACAHPALPCPAPDFMASKFPSPLLPTSGSTRVAESLIAETLVAPSSPIVVWVLVPFVETSDPNLEYYNDYSQSRAEYERVFGLLRYEWRWEPVTMDSVRRVVDEIARSSSISTPIVLNLCDGDETNGVPGLSVIRHLHECGLCYTGADANFFEITTSKITMKQIFDAASVPTSPWTIVDEQTVLPRLFETCGTPLIIKPAISAGSMGITVDSVVDNAEALEQQLALLRGGYRGWDLAGGGLLVERFVTGREFTTFIVGSVDTPDACIVYPPIERVFNKSLPPTEQFLSFDRLWEIYERETPLANDQYLWEYAPAPAALVEQIAAVSRRAYAAVGGCGYGRVDLRMDSATGELFVLEVNAQCGLSEDENYTSIGAILRYANVSFSDAVQCIINDAVRLHAQRANASTGLPAVTS